MSNAETGSPASRLQGARKQLRLALEDVEDPSVAARIQTARRAARRAHDALAAVPITTQPLVEDTVGERLVECTCCGKTGLAERIHSLGCPHDGTNDDVHISPEAAITALEELNRLIDSTEDEEPDPLTDQVFRARDELADALEADAEEADA